MYIPQEKVLKFKKDLQEMSSKIQNASIPLLIPGRMKVEGEEMLEKTYPTMLETGPLI